MSFRPESWTRRALIACTAVSLLGVVSALLDYGLSRGLLWPSEGGLGHELVRLESALLPNAESAAVALRDTVKERLFPMLASADIAAPAPAHQGIEPPHLVTAAMTPVAALGPQAEAEAPQDVNRPTKSDRLAEVTVAKAILAEQEPVAQGASAALFLLSPMIAAAEPTPPPAQPAPAATQPAVTATQEVHQPGQILAAATVTPASIIAGPVAGAEKTPFAVHPPARNPFVTSAAAAATNGPQPAKYGWSDLVRMAGMKGGDGEEPARIFGNLTEKEFRARELRCMATAIYFEARDESIRGQIAVGQVIMTRVRSNWYPNTICGVVYQGQWNRNACQFSFACDGHPDVPKEQKEWETALDVAKQVVSGKVYLSDIAEATHYHATYVHPSWIREVRRIKQIGGHIFYKAPYVLPLASDPAYTTM